jgi:hypothetical protein
LATTTALLYSKGFKMEIKKIEAWYVASWILVAAIAFAMILTLNGCGNMSTNGDSINYTIDGNGTIPPLDENQTIYPDENVDSIVITDNGIIVQCQTGSTCNVNIGDSFDNHSVSYELFYYFDSSTSCCYSCNECDENATEPPPSIQTVPNCYGDISNGWCKLPA